MCSACFLSGVCLSFDSLQCNVNASRGYEYRDENPYTKLPRNEGHSKSRSVPHDNNRYPDQPVSPSEHYKSEDPYEWVAPRRHTGHQRGANRNSEYQDDMNLQQNQNGRSFMNQMYMDYSELMRMRQKDRERQGDYGSPADRPR